MKKITLILTLTLVLVNIVAFEQINPAFEMSGDYLRFTSLNEKSFNEFDDGFNRIALSIAKPKIYKNWSVSSDFYLFGDDVYRQLNWNFNPAYTFKEKYVIAASLGLINKSLDSSELIFGEAEEINSESVTKANIGFSLQAKIWGDVSLQMQALYLNQPKLSFIDSDETLDPYFMAGLDWEINKLYSVGLSFKNEEQQSYFGFNFSAKFPYPNLEHKVYVGSENISYNPTFSLFNYWEVGLGYNAYYDSNLGNQNLEFDIVYEYPGNEKPVIEINELENTKEEQTLRFNVSGAKRFKKVSVKVNNEELFNQEYLWDDDSKTFEIPIKLVDSNNKLEITAISVNDSKIYKMLELNFAEEEIVDDSEEEALTEVNVAETTNEGDLVAEELDKATENEVEEPAEFYEISQDFVIADVVLISIPKTFYRKGEVPYLYKVKKGDNLWNISKNENIYGDPFKWSQLNIKNGLIINNPDIIFPGQIIYIENNSIYNDLVEYTVKKGDNLWNLAYSMIDDLNERDLLIMSNKETMKNPNIIQPGQKILFKIFIVQKQ
jgi:nucleoid-associated protein YgaU